MILIGPGSFYTSLLPLLLLEDLSQALRRTPAPVVYIGNLGKELSVAAASLTLKDKLTIMEQYVGKPIIDAVIVGPKVDVSEVSDRLLFRMCWKPAISPIATIGICCVRRWKKRFRRWANRAAGTICARPVTFP